VLQLRLPSSDMAVLETSPDVLSAPADEVPFAVDLAELRRLAGVVPGSLPMAVNAVRFAASIRPRKFVIEGGDETPVTMPRTAFQLVYPDGNLMLDAGMDKATHDSFGEGEPFYPEEFTKLQRALDDARIIILTHYHADHVAGILQAPNFTELARKTIATRATFDLMKTSPHRPHLRLSDERARQLIVVDYDVYYPAAPGLVLFKAAGHSPDMQMAYFRLKSGQEFLHSVDAAWHMDNIRQIRGKAAPWVKEDAPAIRGQLRWLNWLNSAEPNVIVLVTHDNERFEELSERGVLGNLC
jgi:glyoxylase-like metal-dependent hydrolase (beta-lactamase superfamily II)